MVLTLEDFKKVPCEEKLKDIELEFLDIQRLFSVVRHEYVKHEQVTGEYLELMEARKRSLEKIGIWLEECVKR